MRSAREIARLTEELVTAAAAAGLLMRSAEDEELDGRTVRLDGRSRLNFGSCSYLGLELDPRLRAAACGAVLRYGTQFSSSRAYLESPLYPELEGLLEAMFGGHVLVVPNTTLGHQTALPVLVGPADAVVLDAQVHHSVHAATLQLRGTTIEVVPHSDLEQLDSAVARLGRTHRHVWYLADGVYSMFGDLAPLPALAQLLDRHDRLHLYVDDSHGIGWCGQHGRGPTSDLLAGHDRVVVAASLNKSFAAAGAALVFASSELKRQVRISGGPLMFSGPVQPPMLGVAVAAAGIHLSPELAERQAALRERIELGTRLMREHCLPLAEATASPIRHLTLGAPAVAQHVVAKLLDAGVYTNLAIFPAVPLRAAGIRMTLTLHHSPADIRELVAVLDRYVPVECRTTERHTGTRLCTTG
ncbi:aminotransferase class I/II-fold pyridoxal phosphate-dependent enzyme [Nocardia brasiliensis]|uniref:aminotransferase class I/II-fold pyridoxal phosphate-dependent enzyme n=1 Tax=Nocardia brasiliensis TaxID=37326 RepID=UPI00189621C2|nr:aminotransferase class I/II-fold pyridoxal phosphate-dependent enzyme [Nocardia brasiliensis]MBF6542383.1 aminotransferase class I/II-fold pyridoxal phosphate-dependent enzyme [Nocardia brasiliensis]